MQGLWRILGLSYFLLLANDALSLNQLTRVTCVSQAPQAMCRLEGRHALTYHVYTLTQPFRTVIEIHDVATEPRPQVAWQMHPLISGLHYYYYGNSHTFRAVLTMTAPVIVHAKQMAVAGGVTELTFTRDVSRRFHWPVRTKSATEMTLPPPEVTQHTNSTPIASTHQRKVVVVIDAGHGGKDPGARGPHGAKEKQVVLEIAQRLAQAINRQPGFMAVMTRQGDYYLTLRQRLSVARRYKPDMFVAVHADAYPNTTALGASVYALSLRGATSEAARWIADKENQSELTGGLDLSTKSGMIKSVLLDLSQSVTIRTSLQIGRRIIHTLGQIGHLHHDRVEQAAFVVLKSPDIPSLLVETGFISNPNEEQKLLSPDYQQQLAEAIQHGICHYFEQQPPRNTWLAEQRYRDVGNS